MMNTFLTGINHQKSIVATTISRSSVSLAFGGLMLTYFGVGGLGLGILAGELAATVFLIYFFNQTVRLHPDIKFNWRVLGPALLSVTSVQVYFGIEVIATNTKTIMYPLALIFVLIGTLSGWSHLDLEIRTRMIRLLGKGFRMKGIE